VIAARGLERTARRLLRGQTGQGMRVPGRRHRQPACAPPPIGSRTCLIPADPSSTV
jgi:hypothetical protein